MSRLFVTGATGLLGRAVLRMALERGLAVRALAHSNLTANALHDVGAEVVRASLFDPPGLAAAIGPSSAVLHLATRIPPITRWRERSEWLENDRIRREGTLNLVDAALASDVQTFVYPSVTLVYPDCGSEWIEAANTPVEPADLTDSTLDAERAVAQFASSARRGVVLRMGPFYGPQSSQSGYILDLARRGFSPFIARNAAYHPFIWIEDAATAVIAALTGVSSATYDIVDDEPLTISEIMDVLARTAGRRRLWRVPSLALTYSMGRSLATLSRRSRRVSNATYKAISGWTPSVSTARLGWELIARR